MGFVSVKNVRIQSEAACYDKICFLYVLHYDLFIMRTTAIMLAADCCARHGGNGTRFAIAKIIGG